MQDIQEIFARMQKAKKEQKEIRQTYKDVLSQTPGYSDLTDEMKILREKRKMMEIAARQTIASEITTLEDLKIDLESDQELLSDSAMTKLMKGESVSVSDEYENEYEPVFSVKFKKTN